LKKYSVRTYFDKKKEKKKTHKVIIQKIKAGVDNSRCKVEQISASELALGFHCCQEHLVDFGKLSKIL
jgi:hypothetical protein